MSTLMRGQATHFFKSKPTLTHLPQDVLLHILDIMTPAQIALYSQLCTQTHHSSTDPTLWATLARRHLGVSPVLPSTPASVSALAESLICTWSLVTGAFVPGVPVHFRKGFAQIRARGGIELLLSEDTDGESAYVFGGRHADAAVPVQMPGLGMDFFLEAAGPFPMEGMRVRFLYAVESADCEFQPNVGLPDGVDRGKQLVAVRVRVNGEVMREERLNVCHRFESLEFVLEADWLRTKPRMNSLTFEYDRSSTAALWIREVLVMPVVLPMPKVDERKRKFVGGHEGKKGAQERVSTLESGREREDLVTTPSTSRDSSPEDEFHQEARSPPQPRRAVRSVERDMGPKFFALDLGGGGKVKTYKSPKGGKMPRHMYHATHYRSPRGHAPSSPRAKGR